jgi:alanine dehydrogenase
MVRVLSEADVASVLDLGPLLPVIADAFAKQYRGAVERPDRPHFPVGEGLDGGPLGTGLTMPAYAHGAPYYATKLASVHEGNAERGLPTVNAQIALTDAATGQPVAYMAGTRVTNARTGCIPGLAARELAPAGPVSLGVFGAGTQARWGTRAIAAAVGGALKRVRIYSPSDSRERCAADLRADLAADTDVRAVDDPAAALAGSTVVLTATTSATPVFDGDLLDDGTLVVAVGAYTAETRELDAATFARADRVFADVPGEVAAVGDLRGTGLAAADLTPFGRVFAEGAARTAEGTVVVESVGTAVLDAAAAVHLYDRAVDAGVGRTIPLAGGESEGGAGGADAGEE